MKLGIPAHKVGRKVIFLEKELIQWLKRHRERFPNEDLR